MKRTLINIGVIVLVFIIAEVSAFAQERLDVDLETEGEAAVGTDEAAPLPEGSLSDEDIVMYKAIHEQGLEKYIVQPGDTLWDICEKILGSPWYWQKIWAMNPQIANPHWIEPGNVIYFQQAGAIGSMVTMEMEGEAVSEKQLGVIPEVLDPSAWGNVSEGGKYRLDQYLTKVSSSAFNFYNFRRDGFIAKSELAHSGEIANSPEEMENLSKFDMVYIKANEDHRFSIGQSYQIFRNLGEVEHPATGKDIGYKVRILGKCLVKRIQKDVITAQITDSYDAIFRGDLIRPWKNPVKDLRPKRNKTTVQGYVVDSLNGDMLLAESQVIFLDRGISQGVEEGNRLFVVRQLEPLGYDDGFDFEDLPYEKIGEVIVLSAGSNTSVGMITQSLMNVEVGDKVIMEKNY